VILTGDRRTRRELSDLYMSFEFSERG